MAAPQRVFEELWYRRPTWRWLVAPILWPSSLAYGAGVQLRNWAYDHRLLRQTKLEAAQVISVGNLLVGGAGKTPLVIYLARWGSAAGHRVAVVTRGYGRRSTAAIDFDGASLPAWSEAGDEPRLIARSCPGVRLFVDQHRVAGALRAIENKATVLILDDGMQHRALVRDLDVVVDADAPPGLMPWGPNREPRRALNRADIVIGTGSAPPAHGQGVWAERRPGPLLDGHRRALPLEILRARPVVLLTGIARPERFELAARALGASVQRVFSVDDHAPFPPRLIDAAVEHAGRCGANIVVTAKDRERLDDDASFWSLDVSLRMHNVEALAARLGWPVSCAPLLEPGPG